LIQVGVLLIAAGLTLTADTSITALSAAATEHDLYTSFAVRNAFTGDVKEKIASGLPVTFTYFMEVARRRPLWFDRILVRKTVATTVQYDTLTHQYSLSRRVNDEVTETSVAVEEADMMRWMTTLERVRLADPTALRGADDGSLYVRVKSRLQKRFVLFFIPWDVETGWEKVRLTLSGAGASRGR
jgi:hypothetical protein